MTGSTVLALPDFVDRNKDWLIVRPTKIVVIIVVALVLRFLIHRAINRLTTSTRSGTPRLLTPLKEKAAAVSLFENTVLSERRRQRAETLGSVLKSAASITIWVIAVLTILSEVGIDLAPFVAGSSVVGVALGFGAQSIVKDFLNGMFMLFEDQYGVGDVVDTGDATGTVEAVGLRTTRLRDVNGTVWYVRNGEILRVGNKSQQFSQVVLDVPIHPHADLDAAAAAMLAEARTVYDDAEWKDLFVDEPKLDGVEDITRDQTLVRLTTKVKPLQQWKVAREIRGRIWHRFDELGIPIAYDEDNATRQRQRRQAETVAGPS